MSSSKVAVNAQFCDRVIAANVVFYASSNPDNVDRIGCTVDKSKIYIVGLKTFGDNMGQFYNYNGSDYFSQKAMLPSDFLIREKNYRLRWNDNYVSYVLPLADRNNMVPVFTDTNKFISQDGEHLTEAGAVFFSRLLFDRIDEIYHKVSLTQ